MSESSVSTLQGTLLQLSNSIANSLAATPYTYHKTYNISVKAFIKPLITSTNSTINASIKDFALACALLSSSTHANSEFLSWIPNHLSSLATASFFELSQAYLTVFDYRNSQKVEEFGLDCNLVPVQKRLLLELLPGVLPFLKDGIKEGAIDKSEESDEFSATSARVPVGFAILAAHQLRWFVTQIDYPHLGKLCGWVIPCALIAVDHWSPEVKENQVRALKEKGIAAEFLSSTKTADAKNKIHEDLDSGKPSTRLLYVTLELIATPGFMSKLKKIYSRGLLSLIAIDEAHCISSWGHDFRWVDCIDDLYDLRLRWAKCFFELHEN